jgi:hypothetical protein
MSSFNETRIVDLADNLNNKTLATNVDDNKIVLDSKYLSYQRLYIADILRAEIKINQDNNGPNSSNQFIKANQPMIRINNSVQYRVAICGYIVQIYESERNYCLKVDDGTGCIRVTIWKNQSSDKNSLNWPRMSPPSPMSSDSWDSSDRPDYDDLFQALDAIKSKVIEKTGEKNGLYVPCQGDLVLVRGHIHYFRNNTEIISKSCSRINNSKDELIQMVLPAVLSKTVYSKPTLPVEEYEKFKQIEITKSKNYKQNVATNTCSMDPKKREDMVKTVYEVLVRLYTAACPDTTITRKSFDSYTVILLI